MDDCRRNAGRHNSRTLVIRLGHLQTASRRPRANRPFRFATVFFWFHGRLISDLAPSLRRASLLKTVRYSNRMRNCRTVDQQTKNQIYSRLDRTQTF